MATYYEFYNPATGDRQYSQTGVPPGAGYIQVGDPFPFYPSISSTAPASQQVFATPTGQNVTLDPGTGNLTIMPPNWGQAPTPPPPPVVTDPDTGRRDLMPPGWGDVPPPVETPPPPPPVVTPPTPPPGAPGGPPIVPGSPPVSPGFTEDPGVVGDLPTTPINPGGVVLTEDITTPEDPGASFVSAYTDVGDEAYSPYEQYQRQIYGQLPQIPYGTDAYKRLESAAMRRYAPRLGQFLLSAYPRAGEQAPTFTEWMQGTPGVSNIAAPVAGTPSYQTFQDIVGLSRLYDPTQTTGPLTEQQRFEMAGSPFGGFLTGQPRSAITAAVLGGPQRGYLGQLMSGQAQRLEDLYGKERMRSGSEVFGAPEQGYFSWLSRQLPQTGFGAPATTPATTTFGTPANVPVTPAEVVNPITNTPVVNAYQEDTGTGNVRAGMTLGPELLGQPVDYRTQFADPYGGAFDRTPGGMMDYTNPEDLARIRYTG